MANVNISLSEWGCITNKRTFGAAKSIYSSDMSAVYSGGLVYEYSEEENGYGLVTIDGSSVTEGYLAHKTSCRLRGDLWKQLGVETTPDGLMKVSAPWNQTSVRGVFSSGDAASPMMTATPEKSLAQATVSQSKTSKAPCGRASWRAWVRARLLLRSLLLKPEMLAREMMSARTSH